MRLLARLRSLLGGCRALFTRRRDDQDLDDELQAFLQAATDDRMQQGADSAQAALDARRSVGNLALAKEDTRAAGWEHALELLGQDVRFGMRTLRRSPAFTAAVVLTLGLGIGGNTAIFGVVNTLYFAALPIANPDRVIRLNDSAPGADGGRRLFGMHSQNAAEILPRTDLFTSAVAMFERDMAMTGEGDAERVTVILRTEGWRGTLGVVPGVGRDFTGDEEQRGEASAVVLVSDALWNRRFAGRTPGAVTMHLDGRPYTVVGVMPPGFRFPYEADVWMPHRLNPADHGRDYAVFARMQPGVTLGGVRTALDVVSAQLRARYADELPDYAAYARTLRENLLADESGAALALTSLVGFLLLLACVNVATLLLARSVARRKEFTVRTALGASRPRQLRQMFTETLLLAVAGGAVGVLLAALLAPVTATLIPGNLAVQLGLPSPRIDWRVVSATVALTLAAALASAAVPAFGSSRCDAVTLREGGRGAAADSPRTRRALNRFVVGQVALALVLLAGAAAMLQNFRALQHRDLGLRSHGLLTMVLTPSRQAYGEADGRARLARRLVDDIAVVPGVAAAGIATVNPFGGTSWSASVVVEGHGTGRPSDIIGVNHRLVTPGIFESMGIPLLRGRTFRWADDAQHPRVAIVSARMAARLWPGQDAVGKRVRNARAGSPWITVVGIVGDVADARDRTDPDLTWYLPLEQDAAGPAAEDLHLMIRAAAGVLPTVRGTIARIDPRLAAYDVAEMDEYYARTIDRDRLAAVLMTVFGVFGLVLAGIGAYGVMAFTVAQRTSEFGVRMALGADRTAILRLVFGTGARLSISGVAIGSIGAVLIRRVVASFLPAVSNAGLGAAAATALTLLIVLLAACYLPARRATRVDPLSVLRVG